MTLPKGKIIKAPAPAGALSLSGPPRRPSRAGKLLKEVSAAASLEASAKIAAAEEKSRALLVAAETRARAIEEAAREKGRSEGAASLVAAWVKLRTEEQARDERDLDRTTELARVMAERLVGEALELDPAKVSSIARQVLATARKARRVVLSAHPADADALRADLDALGLEQAAIEIHADEARSRGSLLVETDLGTLDAHLTIQLDRLTRSLRDSFRS
jgi:flagellar biosynthesis/type III secretory pathway protein FliH